MSIQTSSQATRCGYVAIIGRPNVGKSTLLNYLIGQKISITSRKPQTTRHKLLGIKTEAESQIIYVDTPGLHKNFDKAINRFMNKTVTNVINDVDIIIFMVERLKWTDEDELVLENLRKIKVPILLVVNKSDLLDSKELLLPYIEKMAAYNLFKDILPMSALKGHNIEKLEECILGYLPLGEHLFPEDQITDKNSRFLAAELIREKITRQLGEELPYEITVEIEEFKQEGKILHISGLILVEKKGQKIIVIGRNGTRLRLIGSEARKEMEQLFDSKVMLNLWVKIKSGWSDDERALRSLGFEDY